MFDTQCHHYRPELDESLTKSTTDSEKAKILVCIESGKNSHFGGTENGTSSARIKILRPLFNTNIHPKTPIIHFGNRFGPPKSDF